MKRNFIAATLISCVLVAVPLSAQAAEVPEPEYVIVAWSATEGDIWNPAQTLAEYQYTDEASLGTLDALLPCGGYYQVDLYYNTKVSAALIDGGVLYGPQNPTEPHAYVVPGDPWKLIATPACAEKPEPRVYSDLGETFTCEAWTYWTKEGFYDLTFDAVANVWTESAEPTISTETSELVPTQASEREARGCSPEPMLVEPVLAETGLSPLSSWGLIVALLLVAAGGSLTAYRNRKDADNE